MPSLSFQVKQQIHRPVSNIFILSSVVIALFLNGLPWQGIGLMLRPDFVALVMLYWCTHKPLRVGIGISWAVGILADVSGASLFRTARACIYSARIWWRGVASQAADV